MSTRAGSSLVLRPGPTTYARTQPYPNTSLPYPTPGSSSSSRPHGYGAQAGGRPYGVGNAGASAASAAASSHAHLGGRALARERWAAHFGGAHYLEPGPHNRLTLSLRSGLAGEIDFALERLVQVAGTDPDLLRLPDFPGLIDALIGIVNSYLDVKHAQRATVRAHLNALSIDHKRETWRRRACEAGLVIRNIALERSSAKLLQTSKKLPALIADVLEEGARDGPEGEEIAELRLHVLELLEVIAEHVPLTLPGYAIATLKEASGHGNGPSKRAPEPASSPAVRLFPLLVALTRSTDRALVISSFRCLTALSQNDKSEPVFALFSYHEHAPLPKPYPHPIDTAVELLPVADFEISSAVLDFMYQHTLIPLNAIAFAARPDLRGILSLVTTKFHIGARKEIVEVTLPVKGGQAAEWHRKLAPRHSSDPEIALLKMQNPAELDAEESAKLRVLNEPERTLTWMRYVFEADPDSSLTQVAFWTAYRAEFEKPLPTVPTSAPWLAAAEVIKMSTEAHPTAMPMVHQEGNERKFIIRGLRVRERVDLEKVFTCRWTGCDAAHGYKSASALYTHLEQRHVSVASPATSCYWTKCPFTTLNRNEMLVHVRVHVPSLPHLDIESLAADHSTAFTTSADRLNPPPVLDPTSTLMHHRYHAVLDDTGEPAGLGFLACIVIRNVARTVKLSLGAAAGGASVHSLMGPGATSIFEQLAAVEESGGANATRESVWARLERHDFAEAKVGAEALMAIEERLIMTTSEDHGLGKILGEVLDVVTNCRKLADEAAEEKSAQVAAAESM
ncbi:BQ5605_C008g04947 [Microbotryum silenes-dioicae]|uniref:BQ5605_C008g04947 protein n=1 Tax=Microbotryum silenes-dioicae TaxID=796604 RepID=A0A2X0N5M6_9BASI|nr:BQ5605_C008g04947 [Microbotryum silenes-dioicae]